MECTKLHLKLKDGLKLEVPNVPGIDLLVTLVDQLADRLDISAWMWKHN